MNVLVVNDFTWDNFAEVSRRINCKCIDPVHRINYFYGKKMKYISNICNQNMFQLLRRTLSKDSIDENIKEALNYTKFCVIFHNFIEYNTMSSFIIDICNINKIPYFVFSEHSPNFFYNGEYITDKKFKACVKSIEFIPRCISFELPNDVVIFEECKVSKDLEKVKIKLKERYSDIDYEKSKKSIVYLEDSRRTKTMMKELNYIDYMSSRKKWIKDIVPRV